MQFLSEKLSRHLSSLVPGFEGHWVYVNTGFGMVIMCEAVYKDSIENNRHPLIKICPAWQVEDVFRNWMKIIIALPNEKCNGFCSVCEKQGCRSVACRFYGLKAPQIPFGSFVTARIIDMLALDGDTAYQKIEEYLCSILK